MSHPSFPPRPTSTASSSSSLGDTAGARNRRLRLLVAAAGPRDTSWAQALVVRLSKDPHIEMRAVVDDAVPRLMQTVTVLENRSLIPGRADDAEFYRQQACELVEWADLMVCVPLDADGMAKMLAGIAETLLGEVLRGWSADRSIVLVPGMSTDMWANPTTKRQLGKLSRRWAWVHVMAPILWHYEGPPSNPRRVPSWSGFDEVLGIVRNQADLLGLGRDVKTAKAVVRSSSNSNTDGRVTKLPPEIWTAVFDRAGDWELAEALGIYTNLPMPSPWRLEPQDPSDALAVYQHELEWTVLKCDATAICKKLSQSPADFCDLPAIVVRLVVQFALIEVLEYLEVNRPGLSRDDAADQGVGLLPADRRARLLAARQPVVPQPARLRRRGGGRGIDQRPRAGARLVMAAVGPAAAVHGGGIEASQLPGHLLVLDWWRDAAAQDEGIVLRWWHASGIPMAHGQDVVGMASSCGRVEVLETWRRLQGDGKLVFDPEVLVSATLHEHVRVLEWWRRFANGKLEGMDGRRQLIEFRASDIVVVLEDMGHDNKTRRWWAQYGLTPRLPKAQWFQTRHL